MAGKPTARDKPSLSENIVAEPDSAFVRMWRATLQYSPMEARHRYGVAAVIVFAAAALRLAFLQSLGMQAAFVTFYPAVMLAALYGGLRAGLWAAALSAVIVDYFWFEPARQFAAPDSGDLLSLIIFLVGCGMVSWITEAMQRAQARAKAAEAEAKAAAERAQVADALRRSEALLAEAQRIANIGSWEWDVASGEVLWSDQMFTIFGVEHGSFIPTYEGFLSLVHPDDRPRTDAANRDACTRGVPYSAEYRVPMRQGETRVVHARAEIELDEKRRPRRLIGTARDITERKRAEVALQASEQRLRRFYESGMLGVMYWNTSGEVTDANDKFLEMLGYEREDLTAGRVDWVQMTPPEYRHLDEASIAELKATGVNKLPFEKEYIRKDGSRIPVIIAGAMLDEAGFEGVAFVLDNSVRKRAEEALRRSQEEYRHLVEGSGSVILRIDKDMRITFMNRFGLEFFGYSIDEIIGERALGTIVPAEDEAGRDTAAMAEDIMRHPDDYTANVHQNLCKDGRLVWMSWANKPLYDGQGGLVEILAIGNDLSQLKAAEQALRESEQEARTQAARLQAMMGAAPAMIWSAHGRDCHTITGNRATYEFLRVQDGENLSKTGPTPERLAHYRLFADGTELAPQDMPLQRVAASGQALLNYAMEIVFNDGTVRSLLGNVVPVLDVDGRSEGAISAFLDITEMKRAQEELEAAKSSAEQAKAAAEEANQAKDHFLAVLSHELRTPLTPVLAAVSMLQKQSQLDRPLQATLEVVRRNVEVEARLIDDLLDLTRIVRGKVDLDKRPSELATIVQRAVEVCLPDLQGRNVEFGIDAPDGPYPVEADAARLQQVFWNLLKNAVKFTPVGGRVAIRCRRDGDSHVVVEVSDSGEGIAPEVLPRLFNAFEQGERGRTRQFGGLGLGLVISKSLVELHGGTIEGYSEGKGRGATFKVRLPLSEAPTVAGGGKGSSLSAISEPKSRSLCLLLVEDHGDTAALMRELLEIEGHRVHTAGDVATALDLANRHEFDALISDLGLPDGNGIDLMRQLRERGKTLPGIALSGYGQEQDVQQSRDVGFAAHVIKPVSVDRLLDVVAQVVRPRT